MCYPKPNIQYTLTSTLQAPGPDANWRSDLEPFHTTQHKPYLWGRIPKGPATYFICKKEA